MRNILALALILSLSALLEGQDAWERKNGCLTCHRNIEPIRAPDSGMFRAILEVAERSGTFNRCVVCHGGDPNVRLTDNLGKESSESRVRRAHTGAPPYFRENPAPEGVLAPAPERSGGSGGPARFYPDPGSPWVNESTCGPCHPIQAKAQWKSLMNTGAGKIQGVAWAFGGLAGYRHGWGNYDVVGGSREDWTGTPEYREYMAKLRAEHPDVFVDSMTALPPAPLDGKEAAADPSKAAFTYIRGECQRCHLAVGSGRQYGDYRGMGCSACHIPYGNAGNYEGGDRTLRNDGRGRPLVHSIQSGRKSAVQAPGGEYTGIPVETCAACHNRGRRIGVSFQGLMETPYGTPWDEKGAAQRALHGKHYLSLKKDLHAARGFLCQDCHTTLDVHSDNRLCGTASGAVEIECTDCHGTASAYPWELPLGYGDEYEKEARLGPGRGVAERLPDYMGRAAFPAEDGYLLSARGNPLGNAVRKGNRVIVHLAGGDEKTLSPLKERAESDAFGLEGRVAMVQVRKHRDRMECYSCHATWAPQCYGCHIRIDYGASGSYDWGRLGADHAPDGTTIEGTEEAERYKIRGHVAESPSHLRWEDPALGQNGEGRISPVVPGCQAALTLLDGAGKAILRNHIFRIPNVEGAGAEGQLASDMAPLHPHTVQKKARRCETCHADPKALGYGIRAGEFLESPAQALHVDLRDAKGKILAREGPPQIHAVPNLGHDWSRFVSEDGRQLQTVGHHFPLSRPLNDEERSHMQREGICLACHRELPDRSIATSLLRHIADTAGLLPKTERQHAALVNKTLMISAWGQVAAMAGSAAFALLVARAAIRRRRAKGGTAPCEGN